VASLVPALDAAPWLAGQAALERALSLRAQLPTNCARQQHHRRP
jgi:hypothetical protein